MNILDTIRERLPDLSLETFRDIEVSRAQAFKWGAYFTFGLLVFSVVFAAKYYVRQTDELAREATGNLENVTVNYSYLDPQLFPPRVTLDYLRIHDKKTKRPILLLKDTDVRLSLFSLFVGKVSLSIDSRMYGGLVEADISTGMFFNTDWISLDVQMDMVELEKIPQVVSYDRTLKGFATVKASLAGEIALPKQMAGDLFVKIDRLGMENRFPVVKGARLEDFTVVADCTSKEGVLTVHDFDLISADGISLKTDGTITVNPKDFNLSTLDMRGKLMSPVKRLATSVLDPKAVKMLKEKKAVKVTMKGTPKSPQIALAK